MGEWRRAAVGECGRCQLGATLEKRTDEKQKADDALDAAHAEMAMRGEKIQALQQQTAAHEADIATLKATTESQVAELNGARLELQAKVVHSEMLARKMDSLNEKANESEATIGSLSNERWPAKLTTNATGCTIQSPTQAGAMPVAIAGTS